MPADKVVDPRIADESDEESDGDDESEEFGFVADQGLNRIIIVDHLPVVPKEKYEKLLSVVKKIYGQIGTVADISMPVKADGTSKGFAFVEFSDAAEASAAIDQTNGYKLDRSHVFEVTNFADFDEAIAVSDLYSDPEPVEFKPKENLRHWLMDPRGRDQFVVRHGDRDFNSLTDIYWNEHNAAPVLEISKSKITDAFVHFSPRGSYLATCHRQGIVLRGGPSFEPYQRFSHPGVKLIDFSPCENYLVTWNKADNRDVKNPEDIIVWEVRTGKKLRAFAQEQMSWPAFKWSFDDKYFARISGSPPAIYVYETPSMTLLDKKSIKVPGLTDFCWSPTDPLISFFVPETDNTPARVVVMEIPSRKEVRQKNLFNVTDCKMHWHAQGNFLCVKVDRLKSKKVTTTNFELFRIREKDVPIEVLELSDQIVAFAWEPKGQRFCILHGDTPGRPNVSFYTMETGKDNKLQHLKTMEKRAVNCIFWGPSGNFVLLAGLGNLNGMLEFFSAANNEVELIKCEEHYMASEIEWDPTGRYVATCVTRYSAENGYKLWTFNGKLLHQWQNERFAQLQFRPRPPTLLSAEQQKQIKKGLHKYSQVFNVEDSDLRSDEKKKLDQERKAITQEFMALAAERAAQHKQEAAQRRALRDGAVSDDEGDWIETEKLVEEVVEEVEEVLSEMAIPE